MAQKIKSKDGVPGTVRYTQVPNGNGSLVLRYFPVPDEGARGLFVPGFISREEAVSWFENSNQLAKYVGKEQYQG